jgi:Mg2+/Co2+ transporter CorB
MDNLALDIKVPVFAVAMTVAALLVISFFFSMAETALTSASRPRMYALAKQGHPRALLVERLRVHQDQVLSAILIGNNVVNIFASALATGAMIELFGDAGVAYAAIVMSLLVVVFGEVLPKTFALNRADRVILAIAPALQLTTSIFWPVSRAVRWIVRTTLRAVGVRRAERGQKAAVEELRGAIELHASPDRVVRQEREMLRSILDLANVEVGQIMIHRRQVFTINADQKSGAILEQALASPHTRVPLWRGQPDNVIGVLHAKALLHALRTNGGNPDAIVIADVAMRPWFIPESTTLLDQLQAFRRRREHFALVVDEYGALLGVVTLEDILEEIVGDIAERHEFQVPGVRAQPDGSFVIDGHVTIRDLNREFDWGLADSPASTLAGLVLHEARCIPDAGQIFTFHGFRFEILRRKSNKIVTLRVTPPAAKQRTTPAVSGSVA